MAFASLFSGSLVHLNLTFNLIFSSLLRDLTPWSAFLYSVVVQSLSHIRFFVTPWTIEYQASLSITNSRSLLKLMSSESVMSSNHLILCHPLLLPPLIFPSIRVFSSESVGPIRWPKCWSSTSASVLPINIQERFPLGWTGLIFLLSKGLSRVFSSITVQKHQFSGIQLSWWSKSNTWTWLLEKL